MNWFLSILLGLLTGALGLLVGGVIASACVKWYRISSFEGGSGYFVMFGGLAGGVVGFVLGVVMSRLIGGPGAEGFFRGLGLSFAALGALGGVVMLLCWLLADIPPTINGQALNLEIELRLPVGEAPGLSQGADNTYVELMAVVNNRRRGSERGELTATRARQVDGRWVVPGSVELFTTRGKAVIEAFIAGKNVGGFLVPLPRRFGAAQQDWSDWLPKPPAGMTPWPDTKASYRYRVLVRSAVQVRA